MGYVRFMVQTPARRSSLRVKYEVDTLSAATCTDASLQRTSQRVLAGWEETPEERARKEEEFFSFFLSLFDSATETQRVRSRKRRRKKGRRGGFLRSSAKHDFSFTEPRRLLILPSKKKKKTKMSGGWVFFVAWRSIFPFFLIEMGF